MITKVKSLLEQLNEIVNVDADTYDYDFIKSMPIVPHDATSNQGFIHAALVDARNDPVVQQTVKELKGESWEQVYAVCVARIATKVIPVISGRVLAQVSCHYAYDVDAIVANARRYAKAYNAEGITNDRFCIKIPTTSAGVAAAKILRAEGIATLGTTLFSVAQALAAQQAGMHAVSMYLNEPRAHSDPGVWPDVAEPALEAPMAPRHVQIRDVYDRLKAAGQTVPQMKTASFCTPTDALASADLGADHATIGMPVLTDLIEYSTMPDYRPGMWKIPLSKQAEDDTREWHNWEPRKHTDPEMQALLKSDPLSPIPAEEWKVAALDVDYTAPGVLDELIEADPASKARLAMALKRFNTFEEQSKAAIEALQAAL